MENTSFLDWLSMNSQLLAQWYLTPSIYFFFILSLIFFFFIFASSKPPFNEPLTKKMSLLLISLVSLLLFFWEFTKIWILLLILISLGLFKIRKELKQFFLIISYKKKELSLDLSQEHQDTNVILVWQNNMYKNLWFIQFFSDFKSYLEVIVWWLNSKSHIVWVYIFYLMILSFTLLLVFWIITQELFETKYILKLNK